MAFMLLFTLFSGMFMTSNATHQKKTESKPALNFQFICQLTERCRKCWQKTDILDCVCVCVSLSWYFSFSSLSLGYISGTAGWRRFIQWSSSTVSSLAHRSLSRCPQGRTSYCTVWWWSPSAPPNTSASLTWSLVSHMSSWRTVLAWQA